MARSQSAPQLETRVYPSGRAVALYGVATADLVGRRFTLDGQRVQAIRFGRVALLISYVEPDAFTPDVLDRRRHEDGAWMQQQASRHERIIERASVHARVLPQPLLTVFPNPQSLARAARLQSSRWQRSLTRVGEAREYALHVYAGPHAAPGGDPYLLRVSARAVRSQRPLAAPVLPPAVADHLAKLWKIARDAAPAFRRIDVADAERAVLGGVMLLDEAQLVRLREALASLAPAARNLGLTYYLEGPRPPFSFA